MVNLQQVDHASLLVRASGSWELIGRSKWVMVTYWLKQVGRGLIVADWLGQWVMIIDWLRSSACSVGI